jgi:hypothetical protein
MSDGAVGYTDQIGGFYLTIIVLLQCLTNNSFFDSRTRLLQFIHHQVRSNPSAELRVHLASAIKVTEVLESVSALDKKHCSLLQKYLKNETTCDQFVIA